MVYDIVILIENLLWSLIANLHQFVLHKRKLKLENLIHFVI